MNNLSRLGLLGVCLIGAACSGGSAVRGGSGGASVGSGGAGPGTGGSSGLGTGGADATPDAGQPDGTPPASREYQSTASVGDFIQITIDKVAHTASYVNKTNGLSAASVPYTVDANGVYSFAADPNGHLQHAIELEGSALIVDVAKAGPNRDSRALAVGAAAKNIALADMTDRQLNMMQFRTRNGGMEVGNLRTTVGANTLTIDSQSYWPSGAMHDEQPFHLNGGPGTLPIDPGTGPQNFLTATEVEEGRTEHAYIFRTESGFAVDMSNGNIIMTTQPATKAFDPTWAGDYHALMYKKTGAQGVPGDQPEPGVAEVIEGDVSISATGRFSVANNGTTMMDVDLIAVPDTTYLTGPGQLDPTRCNGIFTFRKPSAGGFRDVFVIFTKNGLLMTSFTPGATTPGSQTGPTYDYFYGAAVKKP